MIQIRQPKHSAMVVRLDSVFAHSDGLPCRSHWDDEDHRGDSTKGGRRGSERYRLVSTVDDVTLSAEVSATNPHEENAAQSILARDARSYIGARGRGDESEEHELRSACSGLARFLGQLLAGHEKWSRYYWVDSVLPSLAAVVSDEELSVLGSMIWGENGRTQQWVEPFFASLRVSQRGDELLGYHIMCGDAAKGLAQSTYATKAEPAERSNPEGWIFVFSGGRI
jgi:hypothetical protein